MIFDFLQKCDSVNESQGPAGNIIVTQHSTGLLCKWFFGWLGSFLRPSHHQLSSPNKDHEIKTRLL